MVSTDDHLDKKKVKHFIIQLGYQMKGGYFQRVEVKIQLKGGLIIQKYSCLIIEKAMVTRLIGKDKELFFVTAKAQKKLRSTFFQFKRSDIAFLSRVP